MILQGGKCQDTKINICSKTVQCLRKRKFVSHSNSREFPEAVNMTELMKRALQRASCSFISFLVCVCGLLAQDLPRFLNFTFLNVKFLCKTVTVKSCVTSAKVTSDFPDSTVPVSQFNLMDSTIPDFALMLFFVCLDLKL